MGVDGTGERSKLWFQFAEGLNLGKNERCNHAFLGCVCVTVDHLMHVAAQSTVIDEVIRRRTIRRKFC